MNWYKTIVANYQLGVDLGKWLVLYANGQGNDVSVKNDIMSSVFQNMSSINLDEARQAALGYFSTVAKKPADPYLTGLLDQWIDMIEGQTIDKNTLVGEDDVYSAI